MKTSTSVKFLLAATLIGLILPNAATAQERKFEPNAAQKKGNIFTFDDKQMHGGFTIGWAAKEWITNINGENVHHNLWGTPNKMLHGLQLGVHLNQSLFYGIGWRTGFYYEWYKDKDQILKNNGWDRFSEHCLYIPLHIQFRLPIIPKNENISVSPYAGIGFNIAMKGRFKNGPASKASGLEYRPYPDNNNSYGSLLEDLVGSFFDYATGMNGYYVQHEVLNYVYNNYTPRKFNLQAELGIAVCIYHAQLTFTYSWGLTDHQMDIFYTSRQNKISANLGINF